MQIDSHGILTIPYDIYKKHWNKSVVTERLYELLYTDLWAEEAINVIDGVDPYRNILSTLILGNTQAIYDDATQMITLFKNMKIPFTIDYDDADEVVGIYAYGYFLEDGSYIAGNWDTSHLVRVVLGSITADHSPSLESAQMMYEALQKTYCLKWHAQRMRETADIQMKYFDLVVAEMILNG